jgi:hypothetical protein
VVSSSVVADEPTIPPAPRAARPPGEAPRVELATAPAERVAAGESTPTPPPLPPSPASAAAEVWLEDAVTRPSALIDIAPSIAGPISVTGSVPGPLRAELETIEALREAQTQTARGARRLLALSTVTSFAVGLALGALLFRGCGVG